MLSPAATAVSRNWAACGVTVPSSTSSARDSAATTNLRTLTAMCRRVISGMTTCRRDPSGRAASTNGSDKSMRRPDVRSIRSTNSYTWLGARIVVVNSVRPRLAMNTLPGSLIQISSTSGSSNQRCNGPKPATESRTERATSRSSPTGGSEEDSARSPYSAMTSSTISRTWSGSRTGSTPRRRTNSRTSDSMTSVAAVMALRGG